MRSALPRIVALLLVLSAPIGSLRADPVPPVDAPPWVLKDPDGKTVSSAQFKGKVVVLDFWATWCAPCKEEIPGFIELQKKYAADGLVFVGVSVDHDGDLIVKKFIKDHGINYPIVMAGDSDMPATYGVYTTIPMTYIIDRDGLIRNAQVGMPDPADYEKQILAVLRPPAK
jgi:peroxiredoxin